MIPGILAYAADADWSGLEFPLLRDSRHAIACAEVDLDWSDGREGQRWESCSRGTDFAGAGLLVNQDPTRWARGDGANDQARQPMFSCMRGQKQRGFGRWHRLYVSVESSAERGHERRQVDGGRRTSDVVVGLQRIKRFFVQVAVVCGRCMCWQNSKICPSMTTKLNRRGASRRRLRRLREGRNNAKPGLLHRK